MFSGTGPWPLILTAKYDGNKYITWKIMIERMLAPPAGRYTEMYKYFYGPLPWIDNKKEFRNVYAYVHNWGFHL